jgi:hypothetical protein
MSPVSLDATAGAVGSKNPDLTVSDVDSTPCTVKAVTLPLMESD